MRERKLKKGVCIHESLEIFEIGGVQHLNFRL